MLKYSLHPSQVWRVIPHAEYQCHVDVPAISDGEEPNRASLGSSPSSTGGLLCIDRSHDLGDEVVYLSRYGAIGAGAHYDSGDAVAREPVIYIAIG